MKGDLDFYMYLIFVIIVGLVFVIVISAKMNPTDSSVSRSLELALVTSIHIDSLSTVTEGNFKVSTGDYKYDVEVQKWTGFWRGVTSTITSNVKDNGWYVVVTPYDKDGKKSKDSQIYPINSYKTDGSYSSVKLTNTNSFCVEKKPGSEFARLVAC